MRTHSGWQSGAAVICGIILLAATGFAPAQSYPNRSIRIIDAYPAGGAADFLARVVAQKMTPSLGQNVVVENRPGAGGNLGAEVAARSPADGYTLFVGVSTALTSSVSLYAKLAYDITKDFAPITTLGNGVYVFVSHPSLPVKTVADLIALAKARPNEIKYSSSGNGSGPHLCGELFKMATGTQLVHVPYKGGPPSVTAVIAGETEIGFMSAASAMGQIQAGKLRVLAVTSPKRVAALPDAPTLSESGARGYQVVPMFGIYAATRTPKEVIAFLNAEFRKALETAEVREKYLTQGVEASGSTPEELRAMVLAEISQWAKVVKDAGMRID